MKATLTGIVTDFDGNPLPKSDVKILGPITFDTVYETQTDSNGRYTLEVECGTYMALVAFYEYPIKYLENWNWNFQINENLEVNMRIGELEIYSINAFVPQGSPPPKILVYFRPCSLKRYQQHKQEIETGSIDWTCFGLDMKTCDLTVRINGEVVPVTRIDPIIEACGDNQVLCYLMQLPRPENLGANQACTIQIVMHDRETNEYGEGALYTQFSC